MKYSDKTITLLSYLIERLGFDSKKVNLNNQIIESFDTWEQNFIFSI